MKKVLSFGELLLRLSPDPGGNWIKKHDMAAFLGGAELNVTTALANWDVPTAYCTALPDNYLSREIVSYLNKKRIDTTRIISSGSRIGIYYLAQGTDLKNAEVIYDRAHSSTYELQQGKIDWNKVFKDVSWFHFTAISPGINENLALICMEAVEEASSRGITISVDLNYRSKLWKWGKTPIEVMPGLVNYCHVVMGNIWSIEMMLGIRIGEDFVKERGPCLTQALNSSRELITLFPQCQQVANTFRFDQEEGLQYFATLYTDSELHISKEYFAKEIVDKVGSGDCFMAGLIYGNVNDLPPKETLEFASAAAVDKLFIMGDATTSTVEEIKLKYLDFA